MTRDLIYKLAAYKDLRLEGCNSRLAIKGLECISGICSSCVHIISKRILFHAIEHLEQGFSFKLYHLLAWGHI